MHKKESLSSISAARLAHLHMAAFPGFFLTSLGPRFLRMLYAGFAKSPDGICLVEEQDGRIVGFACGTSAPERFFRDLFRKQGLAFAVASIPGLLKHPVFVSRKCLGAVFYRGEQPAGLGNAALLSSLAVDPTSSGRGVGQSLVSEFAEEAKKRGCGAVYLTTDNTDNERVNRFYERCGFTLRDTFARPGKRTMNRWVKNLTSEVS